MKSFNRFFLALFILIAAVSTNDLSAQDYDSALGVRINNGLAASYKFKLFDNSYIDALGYLRPWDGVYSAGAVYEKHKNFRNSDRMRWYFGGGGGVSTNKFETSSINIDGVIGLDFTARKIPFNMSLDWKPTFFRIPLSGGDSFSTGIIDLDNGLGFSLRYIIGK